MSYKLLYFPVRGRGEAIRLMLTDNDVKFEDQTVTYDSWATMKQKMLFGQVPTFFDGDLELVQSNAILRHLARKHGFYGASNVEATMIDVINDAQEDLRLKYIRLIYFDYETGKDGFVKGLPDDLTKLEKFLSRNNGGQGFLVGSKISFADYNMYDLLCNLLVLSPGCLDHFPLLTAYRKRIDSHPKIQAYHQTDAYKSRPVNGNGKQ